MLSRCIFKLEVFREGADTLLLQHSYSSYEKDAFGFDDVR